MMHTITKMMLEIYDHEIHKKQDTKIYQDKGIRRTTIKPVYGDVYK